MNKLVEKNIVELKNKEELSIRQIWHILSQSMRIILPKEIETGDVSYVKLDEDDKYEGVENPVKYSHIVRHKSFNSEDDYTLFNLVYEGPTGGASVLDFPKKVLFTSSNPVVQKINPEKLKDVYYSLVDFSLEFDAKDML